MPTFVSLFAGCGGSSLGYRMAGYKEMLAIDFNDNAVKTFRLNFNCPVWKEDIRKISGNDILSFVNIDKYELDLLDGSPPCQGFSTAGKRNINDRRNDLVMEYIRLVREIMPKVFVMENVKGMAIGRMRGLFKLYFRELVKSGYIVSARILNAKHYNVPQNRERVFFIGVRKDINIKPIFPKPSQKILTVKDAIYNFDISDEEIIYPGDKILKIVKIMKPGTKMSDYILKTGYNLIRLSWNKPSPTITKTFNRHIAGLIHPDEDRFLTIGELKRLASFPDDFRMAGSFEDKWARIGNAVMPNQMLAIAEAIRDGILLTGQ